MRHKSLSAMDKLLITLRYLATGGIQLNDADMHNVSQPAVSKILTEVTNHLSSADVLGRVALGIYLMMAMYLMANTIFLGTADMLGEGGYFPHTSIPSLIAKQHTTDPIKLPEPRWREAKANLKDDSVFSMVKLGCSQKKLA
ncbi:hypothetical protein MAR_017924, partial [Mya arenaria]